MTPGWAARLWVNLSLLMTAFSGNINAAEVPLASERTVVVDRLDISAILRYGDTPKGDFQSMVIPLKRAGRLFLIEAKIDGQVGNLVFDTGASGLVLNKTYFRKYVSVSHTTAGGVTGAVGEIPQINVDKIQLSSLYYENITADVADLGHLENQRGIKILGLFGLKMVENFEIVLDVLNGELHLYRLDKQGERLDSNGAEVKYDLAEKIEVTNHHMFIGVSVGSKVLKFCIDTGAETNVIGNDLPKKVMTSVRILRRSLLNGAGSNTVGVVYASIGNLSMGKLSLGSMNAIITNLDPMREAFGTKIDGMLGYDFFAKGIVCINFKKKELRLSIRKGGEL